MLILFGKLDEKFGFSHRNFISIIYKLSRGFFTIYGDGALPQIFYKIPVVLGSNLGLNICNMRISNNNFTLLRLSDQKVLFLSLIMLSRIGFLN